MDRDDVQGQGQREDSQDLREEIRGVEPQIQVRLRRHGGKQCQGRLRRVRTCMVLVRVVRAVA